MTALTKDRNTPSREGVEYQLGLAAGAVIFAGAIVCRNAAGFGVPASTSTTLVALGRAEGRADNSGGAADAVAVRYRPGIYKYANSAAGDLLTRADVGNDCYLVDDQTVAKTNGGGTRSLAGKVMRVSADGGVWVAIGTLKP